MLTAQYLEVERSMNVLGTVPKTRIRALRRHFGLKPSDYLERVNRSSLISDFIAGAVAHIPHVFLPPLADVTATALSDALASKTTAACNHAS